MNLPITSTPVLIAFSFTTRKQKNRQAITTNFPALLLTKALTPLFMFHNFSNRFSIILSGGINFLGLELTQSELHELQKIIVSAFAAFAVQLSLKLLDWLKNYLTKKFISNGKS